MRSPEQRAYNERIYREAQRIVDRETAGEMQTEQENRGAVPIGLLIVIAIPCWVLIIWVAVRCMFLGAV